MALAVGDANRRVARVFRHGESDDRPECTAGIERSGWRRTGSHRVPHL